MGTKSLNLLLKLLIAVAVLCLFLCAAFSYLFASGAAENIEEAINFIKNDSECGECEVCQSCESCDSQTVECDCNSSEQINTYLSNLTDNLEIIDIESPLSEDYVPDELVTCDVDQYGQQTVSAEVSESLEDMFDAAAADGIHLYFISGYRSYSEQKSLWNTYVNKYGKETAEQMDAYPGLSEHQLGISVDLGDSDYKGFNLRTSFNKTPAYDWLQKNSWKYGWIERYPEGKEDITGIMYSPWAFRYVGSEAKLIYDSGLTLEEYLNLKN